MHVDDPAVALARTYLFQQEMDTVALVISISVTSIGMAVGLVADYVRRQAERAGPPLPRKRRYIAALDLVPVREKVTKRNGWDEARARVLEAEYRDFLVLLAENDGRTISPWSDDLDLFWHEHILDTRRYAQDCDRIFGHLIQHDPHIDARPSHHEETRRVTLVLREAQLRAREERRRAAAASSTTTTASVDGFDLVTWGCAADTSTSHGGGGSHDSAGGHSCGGHGSDGGGHSCGGGHGCGGHGCGGGGGCGGGH